MCGIKFWCSFEAEETGNGPILLGGKVNDINNVALFYCVPLKLVSAIFYQIFIFTPNDSPSKTMKSVFYLI